MNFRGSTWGRRELVGQSIRKDGSRRENDDKRAMAVTITTITTIIERMSRRMDVCLAWVNLFTIGMLGDVRSQAALFNRFEVGSTVASIQP